MKAIEFEYVRPAAIGEVLQLLSEHRDDAKLIAGGQSLVPAMNMRLAQPALLIDLNGIPGLDGVALEGDVLRIGALARHVALARSALVAEHAPLLAKAAPHIAHEAIRNRGTIGGSLVNADPASEWPACCVALGATLRLRSVRGERTVPAEAFFQGVYHTAIEPDEMLTAVDVPVATPNERCAFAELVRRKGDYAVVGLAATGRGRGEADDLLFEDVRLVLFAVADRPVLAIAAADALRGRVLTPETVREAQLALARDFEPMRDLYTSAAAKAHLARVLLGRVLAALREGDDA